MKNVTEYTNGLRPMCVLSNFSHITSSSSRPRHSSCLLSLDNTVVGALMRQEKLIAVKESKNLETSIYFNAKYHKMHFNISSESHPKFNTRAWFMAVWHANWFCRVVRWIALSNERGAVFSYSTAFTHKYIFYFCDCQGNILLVVVI